MFGGPHKGSSPLPLRGYYSGGTTAAGVGSTTSERFTRIGETIATIGSTIPVTRLVHGSGVSSRAKGYAMGGNNAGNVATIDGLTFSNETWAALAATLDTAKRAQTLAGVSNRANKGYCLGGFTAAFVNVIEDMVYAAETSAAISAVLSAKRGDIGAVSSSVAGYSCGGFTTVQVTTIDKLTFATEVVSTLAATLDTAINGPAPTESALKGYLMGGLAGAVVATIDDVTFSADTSVRLAATLDTAKSFMNGWSLGDKGYATGGQNGGGTRQAVIEDMNYATETSAAIGTALAAGRIDGSSVETG